MCCGFAEALAATDWLNFVCVCAIYDGQRGIIEIWHGQKGVVCLMRRSAEIDWILECYKLFIMFEN